MKKNKMSIVKVCSFFYGIASKERKLYIPIILSYIFVLATMPFIGIVFPKYIIDELMAEKRLNVIMTYVFIIVLGTFVINTILNILRETKAKYEDWFSRKYNMMLSEKAMTMKFSNTESEKAIEAENRAETGMSWYSGGIAGITDCIVGIVSAIITMLGVVYIIFNISPILIVMSLLTVVINTYSTSKINKAQQEVFEKTPKINKFYSYIYQKIILREYAKEIRLYDASDMIIDKALENAKQLNEMDNECASKQLKWSILSVISGAVNYAVAYGWLGMMAIKGEITVSEFVMSITALETLTNSCLITIIGRSQELSMKTNFMKAFIEFMQLEDDDKGGNLKVKGNEGGKIEFKNVSFKYPGTNEYVLKDINLVINDGEHLAIVGMNGAGKTTFIKLLCRLYDVDEGEILVNGVNIRNYEYAEYIKLLSVVFQDFKLFSYSILDNINISNDKSANSMDSIYQKSGIIEWINSLENKEETLLYKDYDEKGVEPSGGEAQKIAIARSLYKDAPIIILDEPTAALDPIAECEVYNKFNSIIGKKTAIYISHRLSSCKFCDKIAVFANKTIKEYGTHQELLDRNAIYAEMFTTQAKWYVEG